MLSIGVFGDSDGDLTTFDAALKLLAAKGARRFLFAGGKFADLDEWVEAGAAGWEAASFQPYFDRLQIPIHPVAPADRNPFVADVVAAACSALDLPLQERWNDGRTVSGGRV